VDEDEALHASIVRRVTNSADFRFQNGNLLLQAPWYAAATMASSPPGSPHSLATASGLLLGTTGAAMIVGALVGWALGSWGLGLLVGAIAGIPLAVFVVYRVYNAPR
jgi:hypothetical protein